LTLLLKPPRFHPEIHTGTRATLDGEIRRAAKSKSPAILNPLSNPYAGRGKRQSHIGQKRMVHLGQGPIDSAGSGAIFHNKQRSVSKTHIRRKFFQASRALGKTSLSKRKSSAPKK